MCKYFTQHHSHGVSITNAINQEQPPILPRPDLTRLGIKHRRIPICSIGRDIYLDTRLILAKLETLSPPPSATLASATTPEHIALQRLLSHLTVAGGVFGWAVAILPPTLPIYSDPAFQADRATLFPGTGKFTAPTPQARAEAIANMRVYAGLLEATLLADGREWLLGGKPGLADIDAVWPLHWLGTIPGALPPDQLSKEQFPRVFAWVERVDRALGAAATAARGGGGGGGKIEGEEAARTIVGAAYFEEAGKVVEGESVVQVLGLKQGDRVVVFPSDYGMTHKDSGSLVSVDETQVVFETKTELDGSPTVRVHAPRLGFRIVREDASHL